MTTTDTAAAPAHAPGDVSPARFLEDIIAFRRSAALRTAIELQLFGRIAGGARQIGALASQTGATARGLTALLDFLVTENWLTKTDGTYGLTPESATFLVPGRPAYLGDVTGFLAGPGLRSACDDLLETVRTGAPPLGNSLIETDHAYWAAFARSMAGLQAMPAALTAGFVAARGLAPGKVLDVAAGHGLFGLKLGEAFPDAQITALDFPNILSVARENAQRMGLADRFSERAGDASAIDWGSGYDLILIPNLLHHFGTDGCVRLLKKAHAALTPGGRVLVLEFAPNDDRVTPEWPAKFALIMIATTAEGNAYTRSELEVMLTDSSFDIEAVEALEPSPSTAFLGRRN